MPLVLETRPQASDAQPLPPDQAEYRVRAGAKVLEIGLLNNMPDAALQATERQFIDLLTAAAGPYTVRLHFFSLADIPRGNAARSHLRGSYGDASGLGGCGLDALIVTGSEPKAATLPEEPYWNSLTGVVDWAEGNTLSTVFSCLAAHAAVLHLDGIGRQPLPAKRFGLFECVKVANDPLLEGMPTGMRIPHSRWNDLNEGMLRSHGYRILTRSLEAGVDGFAKQLRSLFVFFQGHPEYFADTLMREFRRDVGRFLRGERGEVPALPVAYFDPRTERALERLMRAAQKAPVGAALDFPGEWALRSALVKLWRTSAVQIYANWLRQLAVLKS